MCCKIFPTTINKIFGKREVTLILGSFRIKLTQNAFNESNFMSTIDLTEAGPYLFSSAPNETGLSWSTSYKPIFTNTCNRCD